MYSTILYGGIYSNPPIPLESSSEDISFGGFGLQNSQIIIEDFNPFDIGSVEYNTFDIPQGNGKGFLSRYWREKTIPIKGILKASSEIELEQLIDNLKKNLRKQRFLRYKLKDGSYREILATLTNIVFDKKHFNLTWIPFTITFKANEPFWHSINLEQILFENINTTIYQEEVFNNGTEISNPQLFFYFGSSSITQVSVNIKNTTLILNENISGGDFLSIDCLNSRVFLNGVKQEFDGVFPLLETGSNQITFNFTGTVNCDIAVVYRTNFY